MKFKKIFVIFMLILLEGCISMHDKKRIERPYKRVCYSKYNKKSPGWINSVPENKDRLWFVGVSGKNSVERDADGEAYNNAVRQVAAYIGTEVLNESTSTLTSIGKSNEIIDPEEARKEIEKRLVKARTSCIKKKEKFVEECIEYYQDGAHKSYKTYLLSWVPRKIVKQEIKRQQQKQKKIAVRINLLLKKIKEANTLINEADNIKTLRPYKAYENYSQAKSIAETVHLEIETMYSIRSDKINRVIVQVLEKALEKMEAIRNDPFAIFQCSVIGLVSSYKKKPLSTAVAHVMYENTELTTDLSLSLVSKIEEFMTIGQEFYSPVAQKELWKTLMKLNISMDEFFSGSVKTSIKGLVFGRYSLKNNKINLSLELKERKTGRLIGATTISLPSEKFSGVKVRPDPVTLQNWNEFRNLNTNKKFLVKVFPDRGESAVYQNGDFIRLRIKANKDCYVYLYYIDAAGKITLIFPNPFNRKNRVKAGCINELGKKGDKFRFKVSAPFGNEIIKIYATDRPIKFDNVGSNFKEYCSVNEFNKSMAPGTILQLPDSAFAEDVCTVKTVEK